MVSSRAGLEIRNVARWIVRRVGSAVRSLLAHGPQEDGPGCLHAMVRSFRGCDLPIAQDLDRFGRHPGEREISEQLRRARCYRLIVGGFQYPPANALRLLVEELVIGAFGEVADTQPSPSAWRDPLARGQHHRAFGRFVISHELRGPWRAAKPNFGPILRAEINADVAVPVTVFNTAGWKAAGHCGRF